MRIASSVFSAPPFFKRLRDLGPTVFGNPVTISMLVPVPVYSSSDPGVVPAVGGASTESSHVLSDANPGGALVTQAERARFGRYRIVMFVVCVSLAAMTHIIIRQYYPPNIGRSQWLAAFGLLATRNGFAGAAIGLMLGHAWIGFTIGVVVPPVAVVLLYGLPG